MDTASPRPESDRPDDDARPASDPGGPVSADSADPAAEGPVGHPEDLFDEHADLAPEETPPEEPLPEDHEPTLSELLTGTAHGDQASFSAFYEATADVVYGLALLMHDNPEGAYGSTVAVYHHLWHQADERARDLRLQTQTSQSLTEEHAGQSEEDGQHTYRPSEYELVFEWLVPLAHRIIVERFREGEALPISLAAVPDAEGGGVAGLPEEVIEDLSTLSDSQTQALALSYLAGGTHQQIAAAVNTAVPTVKSRLRDGMTRLHAQRNSREEEADPILRAAVTKKDVERSGGVNRNFTNEPAADLEKGLLVELAEIYALDAIEDRERALLDETVLNADEATAQQWDTRVLAARRTLAEVFTAHPAVPPGHLLDEVLFNLHDQEIGMGMVEEFSDHTEETTKRDPIMKRWMILTGLAVVLVLAAVLIWRFTAAQDIEAVADADPDARIVEDVELTEGGTVRAVISETEDVGYLDFEDVGSLEGASYQVWLIPAGEQLPSSLGNYSSAELEEEIITLRNIGGYDQVLVTAEEIRGEERPTGDLIMELPLRDRLTEGPQYGGGSDTEDESGEDQAEDDGESDEQSDQE